MQKSSWTDRIERLRGCKLAMKMKEFHKLNRRFSLAAIDYVSYVFAELRNPDSDDGWDEGEMTALLTNQEVIHSEQERKRATREFWTLLVAGGSDGSTKRTV